MMDMEYNRTSPFISNCLHYSSEFHPYVGEFHYICTPKYDENETLVYLLSPLQHLSESP